MRYKLKRQIYKMAKPADIPAPPEGFGYVGKGVPNCAIAVNGESMGIARFVPVGTEHHDHLSVPGVWDKTPKKFVGVRAYGHYAIPMDAWDKIDYPPKGFDEFGVAIK